MMMRNTWRLSPSQNSAFELNQRHELVFQIADHLTKEERSRNMSRVRGKNTGPERRVRSLLHRMGYRFSLHRKDLPGKPDIILPKYQSVVLVHGCFWHMCNKCEAGTIPKTRKAFWTKKLEGNAERDRRNARNLRKDGWKVITVWECEIKNEAKLNKRLRKSLRIDNG